MIENYDIQAIEMIDDHLRDWVIMAEEVFGVVLDEEQKAVLRSVQVNAKTSVRSGTSRGKDFVAALASLCFLYTTPIWGKGGELIENTKVFMTAPTGRQVEEIMFPEISKLFRTANQRGFGLPGRLVNNGIYTEFAEWFLSGFKADNTNIEAWTGRHAASILFVVTEASGIPQEVFDAIEGNLQGNSRLLIVFNDNTGSGYASDTQKHPDWAKFTLDSLNAVNVVQKKKIIPGQVNYEWVEERVRNWCIQINEKDINVIDGDFMWEGIAYRPNDLFRVKVRGLPPKVSTDVLVPAEWVQVANKRWLEQQRSPNPLSKSLRLGADVAGMGRDTTSLCHRYDQYVEKFEEMRGTSMDIHMEIAGRIKVTLDKGTDKFVGYTCQAFIDTIGEGAGVYSRLSEIIQLETPPWKIWSVKFSHSAADPSDEKRPLKDVTDQYTFLNMRAYLLWAIRDWLDPTKNKEAMLPPDDLLLQELTNIVWKFRSDGSIQIEEKEAIKKKIKRSPDRSDALANTFYPVPDISLTVAEKKKIGSFFH